MDQETAERIALSLEKIATFLRILVDDSNKSTKAITALDDIADRLEKIDDKLYKISNK